MNDLHSAHVVHFINDPFHSTYVYHLHGKGRRERGGMGYRVVGKERERKGERKAGIKVGPFPSQNLFKKAMLKMA